MLNSNKIIEKLLDHNAKPNSKRKLKNTEPQKFIDNFVFNKIIYNFDKDSQAYTN